MVLQLIVSEEVPSRTYDGHYDKIWNSKFNLVGIGSCPHATKGNMTVMHFADTFIPSPYAEETIRSWVDNATFVTRQVNDARNSNNWNPTWSDETPEEEPQVTHGDDNNTDPEAGAAFSYTEAEYMRDPLSIMNGHQTEEKEECYRKFGILTGTARRTNLCSSGSLIAGQEMCDFYLLLNELRL